MKEYFAGIDIGSANHHIVILDNEEKAILDKKVPQDLSKIRTMITNLKDIQKKEKTKIRIAIEGRNGYCRPFDNMLVENGFDVFNVDNLKLKRFKEVFQGEWKTDQRDARMLAKMLMLKDKMNGNQEKAFNLIDKTDLNKERIKIFSRHNERLIEERTRLISRLKKQVIEVCPGFLEFGTLKSGKLLNILKKYPDFSKYKNLKKYRLLKLKGVGRVWIENNYERLITLECVKDLSKIYARIIQSTVKRLLEIRKEQKEIAEKLEEDSLKIKEVRLLKSIPGVGTTTACRLIGEIGNVNRFEKEAKLASYCGVACSEQSSGKIQVARMNFKCNKICKNALVHIAANAIKFIPESRKYYDKKRSEGKGYNHSLRCVGRQLIKVIYKMLKEEREYVLKKV